MNAHWKHSIRAAALVVSLAACGGGGSDSADSPGSPLPAASRETGSPASSAPDAAASTSEAQPAAVTLGAPTQLVTGSGNPITATVNGRTCTVEALFGTCQAHTGTGGPFAVTVTSDKKDFARRTLTIYCGVDNARPGFSATGTILILEAQMSFEPHGEAEGIIIDGPDRAEAMIAFRGTGADCAQVFGLGDVAKGSIYTGGNGAYMVKRPDESTACITATAESFVVSEAATSCRV